jgi:hypothetical protein
MRSNYLDPLPRRVLSSVAAVREDYQSPTTICKRAATFDMALGNRYKIRQLVNDGEHKPFAGKPGTKNSY